MKSDLRDWYEKARNISAPGSILFIVLGTYAYLGHSVLSLAVLMHL